MQNNTATIAIDEKTNVFMTPTNFVRYPGIRIYQKSKHRSKLRAMRWNKLSEREMLKGEAHRIKRERCIEPFLNRIQLEIKDREKEDGLKERQSEGGSGKPRHREDSRYRLTP